MSANLGGLRALVAGLPIFDFRHFLADAHVGVAAELNVGAAAGHVGGDGDGARHAGLSDDLRLLLVVPGVENGEYLGSGSAFVARIERGEGIGIGEIVLLPTVLAQHFGELFGLLDRGGADQHRLAARLAVFDQSENGAILFPRRPIDLVVVVEAHHRHVGGNFQNLEIVDVQEFVGLGRRRAGHSAELLIHAEIVLERDRSQRLVFRLDRLPLLGLKRLVQPFRIAPAGHHAAGELVDDDDLAVAHDVILVALEQLVGAQRLIDVMHDGDILDVVK